MMKMKKKTRYVSPQITRTSALLLSLICASIRLNIQVDELHNINKDALDNPSSAEPLYFEF